MFPLVHFIKHMANAQHRWRNIVAMARDRKGNGRGQLTVGTGVMAAARGCTGLGKINRNMEEEEVKLVFDGTWALVPPCSSNVDENLMDHT